ncbi:MAG: hypothetical protein LUQ31_04835 [Methanoregula sp.]|nr:hypothetical protein [Methanoregula sp.]
MATRQKNLATFTIIFGVLALLLVAAALAEKSHEGHLPERNDRGAAETVISFGISLGMIGLVLAFYGIGSNRNRYLGTSGAQSNPGRSCCPVMGMRPMGVM